LRKPSEDTLPEADRSDGCAHPREIHSLVGHKAAEQRFADAFESGQLHHAWMISGPSGVGKATLAYRMIRRVLGGEPQTPNRLDVPASDPVAQRVQSLGHADFLLIRRPYDDKTKKLRAEIPVATARLVQKFFSKKPAEGGWRVCLIDSMDEMNRNASNAILKTLEEPPENCLLILLSKAPGNLLPTIRSRCMELKLRAVPDDDLLSWLQDKSFEANDMDAALKLAHGAPGKAYALLQNAPEVLRPLARFMEGFPRTNLRQIHSLSESLSLAKSSIAYELFWDALHDVLHAQAVYTATGQWESAYKPMALTRSTDAWLKLNKDLGKLRRAQAGLNMNKKIVLLDALTQIGAA
jgi:DNA polymerase-3 subunit delta'